MSSSESSEDDEESKKINEAVIPDDLLFSLTPTASSIPPQNENEESVPKVKSTKEPTKSTNGVKVPVQKSKLTIGKITLKSKRPDKNKVEDEDNSHHAYFLKTTPEFRAHVGKHLTEIMDRQMEAIVADSVWNKSNVKKQRKQKGIKLFSDVKMLCLGETETPCQHDLNVNRNPPKIRPRKHKLNASSSESSDEEDKISACVFTMDNIIHENTMLENLSKSKSGLDKTSSRESTEKEDNHATKALKKADTETDYAINNELSENGKKKKKKKKTSSYDVINSEDHCDETNKVIKKKKKKTVESNVS